MSARTVADETCTPGALATWLDPTGTAVPMYSATTASRMAARREPRAPPPADASSVSLLSCTFVMGGSARGFGSRVYRPPAGGGRLVPLLDPGGTDRSPPTAVHDLFERPTIGRGDGLQWSVGRVAEGQQVGAGAIGRHAEDRAARVLVADARVPPADAEIGGGQQHRHGRLSEVVLVQCQESGLGGLGQDEDDRRPGPGQMAGPLPDPR